MPASPGLQFRNEAQDSLNDPDELRAAVAIVNPRMRIVAWGLIAFLVILIGWSAWARVPIRIAGSGVLVLTGQELSLPVMSDHSGQVQSVFVSRGQEVQPGDLILSLDQPQLRSELELARQTLSDRRDRQQRTLEILESNLRNNDRVRQQQRATLESEIQNLRNRIPALQQREEQLQRMAADGLVSQDEFTRAQLDRQTAEDSLSRELASLAQLDVDHEEEVNSLERQRLDLTQAVTESEAQVAAQLSELNENVNIVAEQAGTIAEVNVVTGDFVPTGSNVALIAPPATLNADGQAMLSALLYVPLNRGKRVEPGMTAQLDVSSILDDTFGKVKAEVVEVSEFALSGETLGLRLNNDEWRDQIMAQGVPFEVRVQLIQSTEEASGYEWTSIPGPEIQLTSGTFVDGEINQEYRSVLSLVIPAIRGLLQVDG